jgi:hypothetical protein
LVSLSRDPNQFDKGELRNELKSAGFEDCIADYIANRVNDKKADGWTRGRGRREADREIQMFLDSTRRAYDNFRRAAGYSQEPILTPMR